MSLKFTSSILVLFFVQQVAAQDLYSVPYNAILQAEPLQVKASVESDTLMYVLDQCSKVKKLKKLLRSYDAVAEVSIESSGNLREFSEDLRKTLKIYTRLVGYGKMYNAFERNPKMSMMVDRNIHFSNGRQTLGKATIMQSSGDIEAAELKAFSKKDITLRSYSFDNINKSLKQYAKAQKKASKRGTVGDMVLTDSYVQNGNRIFVLKSSGAEFHVAEGCWQVVKMIVDENKVRRIILCEEYAGGVYLPVYILNEQIYDAGNSLSWLLSDEAKIKYTSTRCK